LYPQRDDDDDMDESPSSWSEVQERCADGGAENAGRENAGHEMAMT